MAKQTRISFLQLLFPLLIALPFPFTLMNCARESAPLGGPVDTIAPYSIVEKPRNNSQNVNPQKIVIKFNEFIALENVDDNCMIAPVMETKPDISVRKKKMTINLAKQKLQPNTTYSFNFSNAIKDLTESNFNEQFTYAFSTGSGIDTMKIAGKVDMAVDGSIPEQAYVLLYDNISDTAFMTQKPRYITQISKKGEFCFSNIEAKPYKIYALVDSDKDFTFNQSTEKIAFLDTIFNPTAERFVDSVWFTHNDTIRFKDYEDSIQLVPVKDSFHLVEKTRWSDQNVHLSLFENEVWNQSVRSAERISPYAVAIKMSAKDNPPRNITIIPQGTWQQELVETDSIIVWLTDTLLINADSLNLYVTYVKNKNSQEQATDTFTISAKKENAPRLSFTTGLEKNNTVFPGDTIFITVSRPLQSQQLDRVKLYKLCDTSTSKTCKELQVPCAIQYRPKFHHMTQSILRYKESTDRFALYFSKPIQPSDVVVTLDGLPNLTDWYYCTRDIQSNALLFWYKQGTDATRLKNQAITVVYTDEQGVSHTQNFNNKKEVPVQKMYKNATQPKRLFISLDESQKKSLQNGTPLRLYCNNPVRSLTDSLFSFVDADDSTEQSLITRISLSEASPRVIEVAYTAEEGKSYFLSLSKGAVVDTFGSLSKDMLVDIQMGNNGAQFVDQVPYTITPVSGSSRKYALVASLEPYTNYILTIADTTFTDVFGDAIDSAACSFSSPKMKDYGSLLVKNTKGLPSQNLVYVITKKDDQAPIEYMGRNVPEGVLFENLPAGNYTLSCFDDVNHNRSWDTGCIEVKKQPEKRYSYKGDVVVKSEWNNSIFWEDID